jgi:hypothetical protein
MTFPLNTKRSKNPFNHVRHFQGFAELNQKKHKSPPRCNYLEGLVEVSPLLSNGEMIGNVGRPIHGHSLMLRFFK